jgi:cell division protein FtsZ
MTGSGRAIMGTGVATGPERAEDAAKLALDSPLLDDTRINKAKHLLVNITYGSKEPTMGETARVKKYLQQEAGNTAHLKMGITHDERLDEEISITVIATGFEVPVSASPQRIVSAPEVFVGQEIHNEDGFGKLPQPISFDEPVSEVPPPQQPSLEEHENFRNLEPSRISRENVLESLETPAYLRREKVLFQAPASENNQVSRMTISENVDEVDHIVKPNRHLHDNVD